MPKWIFQKTSGDQQGVRQPNRTNTARHSCLKMYKYFVVFDNSTIRHISKSFSYEILLTWSWGHLKFSSELSKSKCRTSQNWTEICVDILIGQKHKKLKIWKTWDGTALHKRLYTRLKQEPEIFASFSITSCRGCLKLEITVATENFKIYHNYTDWRSPGNIKV